ncbi:type II toxin-antitoxin system PemK/MazF family toxin [Mycolicibacterium fortuitum]|uniref:type II toxin-antitoxin system PemK/MazF family toxin n=1 Tax=Mycolicibacterium fortuitum TaxID=1766 RepID=UPI001CE22907|nr:type II toxin-antitoxin system PemK/MazF family toxin [Mycolicibacterium fortuitum]MCA4724832.1 type II toxin-antitoxin system PemK/MazF family toxin [Mycolicibacterium fortuitum]
MTFPVRRGYIYQVEDKILRLPPEDKRQVHIERRPFLVFSGDVTNGDSTWPVVSGFPISSSTTYRTEFDVQLGAGDGNLSKKGWVRIHAVQPLLKTDLQDCTGKKLADTQLLQIEAQLFRFIGSLSM